MAKRLETAIWLSFVIPLMLNQPPGTNMDNQVYRAHVERSRPRRGPADSKMYPDEDATKSTKDFSLEVTAKIGEQPKRLNLRQTWKDLVTVLKASEPRPSGRSSAALAENQTAEPGRQRSPVLPKASRNPLLARRWQLAGSAVTRNR
eukprot:s2952_g4.t1